MLWLVRRRRGAASAAAADEMTAQLTAKLFLYELYVGKWGKSGGPGDIAICLSVISWSFLVAAPSYQGRGHP